MGLLFDESGQPVNVPDDQVDARYRSGRFSLPDAARYNVRGPDGRVISVAREELNDTLGQGYSLASDAEAAAQARETELEGQVVRTGLEGVARGATLGASDVLLEGIGAAGSNNPEGILRGAREAREDIATRRELSPNAAMAGEAVGAVAPMLVPGAGMAPAAILARAGEAAGARVTAGLAARGAGRVLARGAGLAVEGAAEGAVQGAAQALTEAHLEDRALTAETLLAGMGSGVLWGGALGGGLGGAVGAGEAVASAAGRAARSASARVGARAQRLLGTGGRVGAETADAVEGVYRRMAGPDAEPLGEGVAELYARGASVVSGADETAIREMTNLSPAGQRVRELVTNADQVMEQSARAGREVLDASESFARVVQDESIGSFKRENIARMLGGRAGHDALQQADEMLSVIGAQADEMLADSATWGERAAVGRIREDVDILKRRMLAAMDGGDEELADVFIELDQFKRRMGRNARPGRFVASSQDSSAVARIRDWYEQTRTHLESTDLYGDAASAQREINSAWARYLGNAENYRGTFMQRVGQDAFNPVYTHDPGKLESFLRSTGRTRNDLAEEALRNHVVGQRQLVEAIGKHYDISPKAREALEAGRTTTKMLETWLDATRADVGAINRFRAMADAGKEASGLGAGAVGGTLGALAGMAVGMPGVGAAAGAALGQLLVRPDATVRTLAALERMNRAMGDRIGRAARGLLGTGRRAADDAATVGAGAIDKATGAARGAVSRGASAIGRGARQVGRAAAAAGRAAGRAATDAGRAGRRAAVAYELSSFEERAKQVREAQGNVQAFTDRVAAASQPLAHAAPQTTAMMATGARRAVDFLAQRLPQGRLDPIQPLARRPRVSEQARAQWLRYARAVDDPVSVIDDVGNGEVNREGVEVLRELYPAIYQRLQAAVAEELGAMTEPLPYAQRLQLGILLQIPADRSLEPGMVQTLQMTWATPPAPQAPPTPAPQSTGRAPDIASAAPMASDMDSFERRRAAQG